MTDAPLPEFSRVVPLARVGWTALRQEIVADESERRALARRFDLFAIDRLSATVELIRQDQQLVLLRAALEGEFVQRCVVTLDPVSGAVSERFSLLFGPPEAEDRAGGTGDDECAFEPLADDAIDIGEAVAQEFSLALPLFPRSPGATIEGATQTHDEGPFAALLRLPDGQNR